MINPLIHASMGHEIPMAEDANNQHDQHSGCKIDCNGGAGCDGWVTVAASINHIQYTSHFAPISTKQFFYFDAFSGITSAIELPPPRA